jgi:hypothetical protein
MLKGLLLALISISFLHHYCQSQSLDVDFFKAPDTVKTSAEKQVTFTVILRAPNQTAFAGHKVELAVENSDFSIPAADVFLPSDKTLSIDNTGESNEKAFTIIFNRHDKDDRTINLRLNLYDATGNPVTSTDSRLKKTIYIKPSKADTLSDASKNGYEFWLFTGTNLDLLDGVKAKELYFKGSYLVNIKKNNTFTKHWIYTTFGKNRYFSDKDSLGRVPFSEELPRAVPGDSITLVRGSYSSLRESVTDNIFTSFEYLNFISDFSSPTSKIFATLGFSLNLQSIKTSYTNKNILSDTSTFLRIADSSYVFRPLNLERKIKQFNYNLHFGFTHILSTDAINIKTQLIAGINRFTYPYASVRNSTIDRTFYKNEQDVFFQLKIDATVLSPGISIGFEFFLRRTEIPLFNVSLTKVLDIKQIGSLFGKVPAIGSKTGT